MRIGRIAESIWKRSVLNNIKKNRNDFLTGAGIGVDCAIFSIPAGAAAAAGISAGMAEKTQDVETITFTAINRLSASGAEPVGLMLSWILPEGVEEERLKVLMKTVQGVCDSCRIEIAGVQIQVSSAVSVTVLSVTALGNTAENGVLMQNKLVPGMDIVVSKWIGLEGTFKIAEDKEEALAARYPVDMVGKAKGLRRYLPVTLEAATAIRSGASAMHYPGEGGIYGALWEMAEGAGVGLDIDLKLLPIRQETIEICEFYEISPYELVSGGCMLMAATNGYDLVNAMEKEGIPATVVGKATGNRDRVLRNEEERRFLEPPRTDEIHKIL